MTDIFHQRIRASLADENLQAALDANAERRIAVRQQALLRCPTTLRCASAPAVRADERQPGCVPEQFPRRPGQWGDRPPGKDAAQAVQTVLDISQRTFFVRQHGARLLAKSKTMVSEEIGLNRALEAAGLRVVETDLGEYIVQLRDEPPSHIITPAVLRRGEVGQTFHEKLGIPLTEDIPTLTQAARQALREVFLTAEIGISGVNFGVVETGTLCVLTNEGNGRMVTTVPRVHIALMGMERLVPTLDDLALMLNLLPRSATGQKITVYTSLLHGPRRAGDPDGPQERHLVVVDNGRSAIRQSPLAEIPYCIRRRLLERPPGIPRSAASLRQPGRAGQRLSGADWQRALAGAVRAGEFGQLAPPPACVGPAGGLPGGY
jgi:L-lactate dehydrogenase complex protein LldF